MVVVIGFILIIVVYTLLIVYLSRRDPENHWDWTKIDETNLNFPDGFLWGTGTSAHQVEGECNNNNWHEWENSVDESGQPRIHQGSISGIACDHWNRYREDIRLMQDLGMKSYRFSLEWSKIEPEAGRYDPSALQHYSEVIDTLIDAGIEPMITLYHFTHPIWFKRLGGFEKSENIAYFQRFCERVFKEYSNRVLKWCTINEIEVEATQGYFFGFWPPGKRDGALMGKVMKNLLEAHVRIYHTLKNLPHGNHARIGLVKVLFQMDPWRSWYLMDHMVGIILNRVFNKAILTFLTTGTFRIFIPGLIHVKHTNPKAVKSYDFFGLNYYSHLVVRSKWHLENFFEFRIRPKETASDMGYAVYPEGLYRALKEVADLGRPIYVTENGIADRSDDHRGLFIRRSLYALSKAIEEGLDVRGYYYWSLMDNFEWAKGYGMKFGLYEVDFSTQRRTLRQGSHAYQEIIRKHS